MQPLSTLIDDALAGADGRVFVGFSGGLDSTALLHATRCGAAGDRVEAVHVHHGLSRHADDWAAHCEAVADALGVPLRVLHVEVASGNLEAAARDARYAVWRTLLTEPGDRLLLGHHAGDQSETLLLRLAQGRGTLAMPQMRRLGAGWLLRPWRATPRAELERYARDHKLRWIDDPDNENLDFDRNFLRHRVLPELRQRFADVDAGLSRIVRETEARDRLLERLLGDYTELPVDLLKDAPEAVTTLRVWLAGQGHHRASDRALEGFLTELASHATELRLDVGGVQLGVYEGRVYAIPESAELARTYPAQPPDECRLPHGVLAFEPLAGQSPAQTRHSIQGQYRVCFREGGERLPAVCGGGTLKELFRVAGVPPWRRNLWPLLYAGSELILVPGLTEVDLEAADGQFWRPSWNFR